MPVFRYRSVEEMPRPERQTGDVPVQRIRALWTRAFLLSPPDPPRGVLRFRTLGEANEARDARTRARMQARRSDA